MNIKELKKDEKDRYIIPKNGGIFILAKNMVKVKDIFTGMEMCEELIPEMIYKTFNFWGLPITKKKKFDISNCWAKVYMPVTNKSILEISTRGFVKTAEFVPLEECE